MRTPNPALQQQRKQQILQAAVICFTEQGFHQTSMQTICDTAGMSPGSVYRYFNSKEEIIVAIAEEDYKETMAFVHEIIAADNFIQGFIKAVKKSLKQSLQYNYAPLAIEIAAEISRNPKVALVFRNTEQEAKQLLKQALKKAQEEQQINPNLSIDASLELLIALYEGLEGRIILNPEFNVDAIEKTLKVLLNNFLK